MMHDRVLSPVWPTRTKVRARWQAANGVPASRSDDRINRNAERARRQPRGITSHAQRGRYRGRRDPRTDQRAGTFFLRAAGSLRLLVIDAIGGAFGLRAF